MILDWSQISIDRRRHHCRGWRIFSGGPAGDSPVVTRYQQEDQALLLGSFGATLFVPGRPVVELGVLRNSYSERDYSGGTPATVHHTFYDLFVGVRVGTSR